MDKTYREEKIYYPDFERNSLKPVTLEKTRLINGSYLIGPVQRAIRIIDGVGNKANYMEPFTIYDSQEPSLNHEETDRVFLGAPLDWVLSLADRVKDAIDEDHSDLFQTHAFTTVAARRYIDLDIAPRLRYDFVEDETETADLPLTAESSKALLLWRLASAISLRAVLAQRDWRRAGLVDFMSSQARQEFLSSMTSADKTILHIKRYNLEPAGAYKIGCLVPATPEELIDLSPSLFKVANM